jgi:putative ABC transport system ATP-binding protein
MKNIIDLKDIKMVFDDGIENRLSVLNGVNCTVRAGSKVTILGESGSGKSTLLNIIGQMIQPTSGLVVVEGIETTTLDAKKKAAMRNRVFGYIVQEYALIEEDTAFKNIELPLWYRKQTLSRNEKKDKVLTVLDKVGIPLKAHEKVKNLSGGQRQRVAIARALVNDPRIILADEPTGSLDEENGKNAMKILDSLVEAGITLILVTHNKELCQGSDDIFEMKNGILQSM